MYRITGNFVESIDTHPVRAVRRFARRIYLFPDSCFPEFLIHKFISGTHELRERRIFQAHFQKRCRSQSDYYTMSSREDSPAGTLGRRDSKFFLQPKGLQAKMLCTVALRHRAGF